MPPGSSSRSKMVPKKWSGPRLETQGSAPLARCSRPRPCVPSVSASRCRKNSSSGWKARCRRASRRWRTCRRICATSFWIARIRGVPDQRVLAPRHEGGGAADFAERRDRLNGAAQIGRAIPRVDGCPMRRLRRDAAAARRDRPCLHRCRRQRCEFLARDRRDLIGDRRRWQGRRQLASRDTASEPMKPSRTRSLCSSRAVKR